MIAPDSRRNRQHHVIALGVFFAALVIVGLRPLIQETHDTRQMPFAGMLTDLPESSPLPTLWINTAILAIFGITGWLQFRGALPAVRSGLGIGTLVLVFAASGSCFLAGNHRLAINATLDWLTLPLLCMALAALMRETWQQRLLLAVVLAAAAASAVESFDQVLVSFPATIAEYQQDPESWWTQSGPPPQAYQIALFEKRLHENAAHGFFAMANVAGSYYVLGIFAALGLAWGSRRRPATAVVLLLPAVATALALLLTRGRGAIIAALGGGVVVVLLFAMKRVIARRPRAAFASACLAIVLGLGAVTTVGLTTGKLPGGSLTYRWWYLESTARMVADHPLGVGSAQYGRFYPRYKDIKSPEEIANPHNLFAQAAAEWGIAGLGGMLLLIWGLAHRISPSQPAKHDPPADGPIPHPLLWVLLLSLTIWGLRVLITGHRDPWIIVGQNAYACCGWIVALTMCVTAEGTLTRPAQSAGPSAVGIIGAGLLAFGVHNLISFSLFIPGAACTAFALAAVCLAARGGTRPPRPAQRRAIACALVTTAAIAVMVGGFIRPVSRAWHHLQTARAEQRADPLQLRSQHAAAALLADPLDPTAAHDWLEHALSIPSPDLWIQREFATLDPHSPNPLLSRDPENLVAYRLSARAALSDYHRSNRGDLLSEAVRHYEQVLLRYPSNPDDHLRMSAIQYLLFEHSESVESLDRAIAELRVALELNDRRDPSEIRRFSESRRMELQALLQEMGAKRGQEPFSRREHGS